MASGLGEVPYPLLLRFLRVMWRQSGSGHGMLVAEILHFLKDPVRYAITSPPLSALPISSASP
jgi:hypothetical protein